MLLCMSVVCSFSLLCSTLLYKYSTIYSSPFGGDLNSFQVLAIMNKGAMKTLFYALWWTYAFTALGYISGNGMTKSQSRPIFGFTRHCQKF